MPTLLLIIAIAAYHPYYRCPHGWHRATVQHKYACVRNGAHGPKRPIMLRDLP
jgi:hypothetical protein